jgi:RNA-directed DNA polymerase
LSALQNLRLATSLKDVADILGYRPSSLSYLLYKFPLELRYTTFLISKKAGGSRQINAPTPKLKALQRKLADILYECCAELAASDKKRPSLSHAFRKSHSILTNARLHKNRRYVLNLDLESFFPSLNFGRIRGFFIKNNDFKLNPSVATVIAQIACHNDVLPQGSPCSPIISELVTHFLDVRLAQLAKKQQCTYSRYADDITFSTNKLHFPTALARKKSGMWTIGKELTSKILDAGFSVNHGKTRMQFRGSRQTVTGLTVNAKVNIRSDFYRTARAMAHSTFTTGQYKRNGVVIHGLGPIEGMLTHIYYVKQRWQDLQIKARMNEAEEKDWTKQKYENPSAALTLFSRFLFYKHFIRIDAPLIICEGKTDSIYLRSALRNLPEFQPKLATIDHGRASFHVRFFKYGSQAKDVLRLGGGTGDLKRLLAAYPGIASKFQHAPMAHPVIVLIDNDDGAKSIFSIIKDKFHVTADFKTDLPFYHLSHNLFLVKTPSMNTDGESCIEDLFSQELLQTKLDGKIFNPSDHINPASEYGKAVFAERIVSANAATIDFSKFSSLLSRIVNVLDYHESMKAKV